jgi:hypothetical protein
MTVSHQTGPTGPGTVILEIGEAVGALILFTRPDRCGSEIEISPSAGGPRTHSMVRERQRPGAPSYAAVYPSLPAATYTIHRPDGTPAGQVTIRGGQATRYHWTE